MSELNLKVSLTDVEKNQLAGLIALWEGSDKWQQQALYFSDRSRAIDQIKRLYAVIMGFALTTAIGNAYLCLRMLKPELKSFDAYLLIIAPLIPFVSLLALFYLGAERLLDRKYLEENPQVTPHKLGLDLATVGLTAIWFVFLANSFLPPVNEVLTIEKLKEYQYVFLLGLTILYGLDIFFLVIQLIVIHRTIGEEERKSLVRSHWIWLGLNVFCGVIVFSMYRFQPDFSIPLVGGQGFIPLALVFLHAIRFLIDFGCTFGSYYPKHRTII